MKQIMANLGITVLFVQNKDVTTLTQKLNVQLNRKDRTKTLANRGQVLHLNDMSDSRIIPDHELDHTHTKSVDNKLCSRFKYVE